MIIRQETAADYDEVYRLIQKAFRTAEHTDHNEHNLVTELRKSESFIPELSLVAAEDGRIVGHILFTKAHVKDTEVLALAPLAVLPGFQHRGIGISLIEAGHKTARRLGYRYSVVLGYPAYYTKAGYVPASLFSIKAPPGIDERFFMAICLDEKPVMLNGVMTYDKAFYA